MRLNRLDLNLLVALDALLTERSITRAAEKIHLSQPATSGALSRLREYFGDELLVRVGSKMKPTPLGESLANPVHNILIQIQATVDKGIEFEGEESDRCFRFLLSDYTSTTIMADVARKLAKEAPKIKLEFFMPTDEPEDALEKENVDFLIMPTRILSKKHPIQELYHDEFVCLVCEDNPVVKEKLTLERFLDMGHVSIHLGSKLTKSQDQIILFEQYGLEPRIEITASTFNAIPQYLPGTHRIATTYRKMAENWCQYLPLTILPLPVEIAPVPCGIQWHQYRDLDPGIQWMRKFILDIAQNT